MTGARVLVIAALALGSCATPPVSAPKVVRAYPLPSYQVYEECFSLNAGDRVDFAFESSGLVDFNIHYREGQAVVMPISREKSRGDSGIYAASIARDYCLMWEAGAAGASIDYRILIKPGGS